MDHFVFSPKGVCSRSIEIDIDNNIISSVKFVGGCSGNTQGLSSLLRGMNVDEAIRRLSGIKCGFKSTSCPDQFASALKQYLNQRKESVNA